MCPFETEEKIFSISRKRKENNFVVHYVKQSDSYEVLQEKLLYMFCAMQKTA